MKFTKEKEESQDSKPTPSEINYSCHESEILNIKQFTKIHVITNLIFEDWVDVFFYTYKHKWELV